MIRALLCCFAMTMPGAAAAAWQEASSKHFVVYSDDAPDKVKAFTVRLERYDKAMHVLRNVADEPISPSSRVTVYIVRDTDAIHRLFGKGGADVAGFYNPRASGSVAFVPRSSGDGSMTELSSQAILLHEYAHHFMFSTWGNAAFPGWFVEGFAEFNATAKFKPDGGIVIGSPPLYRAYGIMNTRLLPAKRLLTADPNSLPQEDRDAFYGRAWLLTHYLAFDAERRNQFSQYIAAINAGQSPADAGKVFGDWGKLDSKLDEYVSRSKIAAVTLPAADLPIEAVTVRALSSGEAAVMPALIQSARGVDAKGAQAVVALARKAAAPYPNDPAAQNELAEAEFDAGNFVAARDASSRALAADPKSIHALLYQGMAAMSIAGQAKTTDTATWAAIRHGFLAANHVDVDAAWPMVLFYQSFAAAGQSPTANAQAGLLYAHQLAPFDPGLSLTAAGVYLRQGKIDEARRALKPVAYNPHGEELAHTASETLAALDSGGASAALATLDRGAASTARSEGK